MTKERLQLRVIASAVRQTRAVIVRPNYNRGANSTKVGTRARQQDLEKPGDRLWALN